MSYEPQPVAPASSSISVHVPVAILALTMAIFLFTQIRSVTAQSRILRWQITNAEKQQTALTEGEKQLSDAWTQREPAVKQSVEIQAKYQSLFSDLLELAKEDPDARKVVEDWKIQKPAPAATPATAPAATPAPAAK
jgi:Tfp pilus assembly protein PilX